MRFGHKLLAMVALANATLAYASPGGHPPQPIGDFAAAFGEDAYPVEAMRAQEQGRVQALVTVDIHGTPTACAIDQSSKSKSLDTATCDIAMAHGIYHPATNDAGMPIEGVYKLSVNWMLPIDGPYQPILLSGTSSAPQCTVVIAHRLRSMRTESCRVLFDRFYNRPTPPGSSRMEDADVETSSWVQANLASE